MRPSAPRIPLLSERVIQEIGEAGSLYHHCLPCLPC